jgi:flagellar basal body-associated protein FliL
MIKIIVTAVVIVVAAIAAYMFLLQGDLLTPFAGEVASETASATEIDQTGAEAVSAGAETAVTDIAGEISSADNLEVPGVDE